MKLLLSIALAGLILSGCQKEIDWGLNSGSDGDLLISSLEVTQETNDTNRINLTWDGSNRLTEYRSLGIVNAIPINISHRITRLSDGKISKIISKTGTAFIDSIVYFPFYDGDKLSYVIDSVYNQFQPLRDSTRYVFNSNGFCTEIEQFTDIFGTMEPVAKRTFVYDASGNPLTELVYGPDGGGGYQVVSTISYTYNGRRSAVTLGDEGLIVFPITTKAGNDLTRQETVSTLGNDLTYEITGQQYNNFNRPRKASILATSAVGSYTVKVTYSYQ